MTVRAYAAAFVALAATYSSIAWPARAQDQTASPALSAALDRIAAFAPVALQRQGGPGMVVAITDRTHTLRIVPVGYRDLSGKVPVAEGTRFGIGSLTKSMTATALLELRDEGRLDPSKTVTTYLPWFHVHSVYRPICSRTPAGCRTAARARAYPECGTCGTGLPVTHRARTGRIPTWAMIPSAPCSLPWIMPTIRASCSDACSTSLE